MRIATAHACAVLNKPHAKIPVQDETETNKQTETVTGL